MTKKNTDNSTIFPEKNITTHFFVKAVEHLIIIGEFKNISDFCSWSNYNKTFFRKLKVGSQSVPHTLLHRLIINYSLNSSYFYPNQELEKEELFLNK